MVRSSKKQGRNKKEKYQSVNSDSENDHYADDFDPKNPFGGDDIEDFNSKQEKILVDKMSNKSKKPFDYSSEEDEVLAFDDDEDDESEEEEVNEENEDEELVSSAWGRKKSSYYSGNRIENEDDAELEEQEAKILQSKMMKQLDTNDFGLDAFKLSKKEKIMKTSDEIEAAKIAEKTLGDDFDDEDELKKISKNLSKLSKKEKLDFLKQESPELFELVRDFKEKIEELQKVLLPVYRSIKSGHVQNSLASEFVVNKTKLYLMYASHMSFYFALKSQRLPVDNHPIVKNILHFRNLCKQITPIDEQLKDEIEFLADSIENNRQLNFKKSKTEGNQFKKSVKFTDMVREGRNKLVYDDKLGSDSEEEMKLDEQEGDMDPNADKRAINYEMMKNKGLTPKRDKMYRNPRVRNRIKARKANIKYKSIVPKVRGQEKRYGGEATGIRTNIVRAVKIK